MRGSLVFVVLLVTALSCSSSKEGSTCTVGQARACTAWNGDVGAQVCHQDGTWSACQPGVNWGDVLNGDLAGLELEQPEVVDPAETDANAADTHVPDTSTPDATPPDVHVNDSAGPPDTAPDTGPDVFQWPDQIIDPDVDTDVDSDGDTVPDYKDNCLAVPNADQKDFDHDLTGDACDPDDDGDWVSDVNDEAPLDPTWPGLTLPATIYAHTSSRLYSWNPLNQAKPVPVEYFDFDTSAGDQSITDIAIDVDGHLYAVSFDTLYRCSAVNARCKTLASLPGQFNGFTLVPKGTVDATEEVLIGVGNSGTWNRITVSGSSASITQIGSYGGSYTSSGDAFSVTDLGTYASVKNGFSDSDYLVKVDPVTGKVQSTVGTLTGYSSVYGLAGLWDKVYGFDAGGAILSLDLLSGQFNVVVPANQGESWWGAGVSTRSLKDPT